jgi:hypothetical protein
LWKEWCDLACEHTRADDRQAITDLRQRLDADCLTLLKCGRLFAFGRRGHRTIKAELIVSVQWQALSVIDWEQSSAGGQGRGTPSFLDIRLFPPLLAPCRIGVLAGYPLAEAFKEFVLRDPEVAALGEEAVRLSPDFTELFLRGRCHPHGVEEWPLAFDRWVLPKATHPDPAKGSFFDPPWKPDPIETVIAVEALTHRYRTLISVFRRGELEGHGLPVAEGQPDRVLRSIWSHRDFHLDARNGDILQVNREAESHSDWLSKRWIGVVLQRGAADKSSSPCVTSVYQTFYIE